MAAGVSRNDPCPCGSGLKYKRCHEGRDLEKPRSSGVFTFILLVLVIAAGAAAIVIALTRGESVSSHGRRVWSPEHGHWHDVPLPSRSSSGVPFDARSGFPSGARPAPPGTPPPGKVWSPEHGHWHDVVRGSQVPAPGVTIVSRGAAVTPLPR